MSQPHAAGSSAVSTPRAAPPEPVTTPVSGDTEYTLWAVLRRDPQASTVGASSQDLVDTIFSLDTTGVTLRGLYDTSSIKADSDVMVWLHGKSPEAIQTSLRELRRTELLRPLLPTWNTFGVHRDAEFSADHIPAFMRGK